MGDIVEFLSGAMDCKDTLINCEIEYCINNSRLVFCDVQKAAEIWINWYKKHKNNFEYLSGYIRLANKPEDFTDNDFFTEEVANQKTFNEKFEVKILPSSYEDSSFTPRLEL